MPYTLEMMKYLINILFIVFFLLVSTSYAENLVFVIPSIPTYDEIPIYVQYQNFIRESLAELNIQVEFKPIPTMRQFDFVKKGKMDAVMIDNPHLREETPEIISTSFPLLLLKFKIVRRKNDFAFNKKKLDQLEGATVLSWYLLKTEVQRKNLKHIETPSVQQNIKMLLANRVDYVIAVEGIAKDSLELITSAKEELHIDEQSFVDIPIYFSINKKHAKLLPKIEKSLKRRITKNAAQYHLLNDTFYPL